MANEQHSNIILIDADFLEFITTELKEVFEKLLCRKLNTVNIADLLVEFANIGGIKGTTNDIEVITVYDNSKAKYSVCEPSSIPDELTDVAFADTLGEFVFRSYPTEQIVSCSEMFLDSLQVICNSDVVKRLIVVGDNQKNGKQIKEILNGAKGKIITNLTMSESDKDDKFASMIVAFPVMSCLGITADELKELEERNDKASNQIQTDC